jgi:hypothetical protein
MLHVHASYICSEIGSSRLYSWSCSALLHCIAHCQCLLLHTGLIPDKVKDFAEASKQSRTDDLLQAAVEVMVRYATAHPSQPAVIYLETFRNMPENKQVSLSVVLSCNAILRCNAHYASICLRCHIEWCDALCNVRFNVNATSCCHRADVGYTRLGEAYSTAIWCAYG